MRAGLLRQRITIQKRISARNDYGEDIPGWADVVPLWGSVEPFTGSERWAQGLNVRVADRMTRIKIRYYPGLDETMRVSWSGQYLNIERIINIYSRDQELILLCSETTPGEA